MIGSVRRKYMVVISTVVLSLVFAHLPVATSYAATICQYEAAYPPDLPDCLDPVVAAQVAAATQIAEDARLAKIAADTLAAEQAAAAALVAAADRAAAAAAADRAAAAAAAAAALAEQIRQGNLAGAARAAKAAADKAIEDAETARIAKETAEAVVTARIAAEATAQANLTAAREALATAQAKIAQDIADARAESDRQRIIALEKKRLSDEAAAKFAEERIALDRQIAEAEAARIAKETAASASLNATTNARDAYIAAGGSLSASLRAQLSETAPHAQFFKKEVKLTQPRISSNLKIANNQTTIFVTAELSRLLEAYENAKLKSDADRREADAAIAAKLAADNALAEKKAIADAAALAFRTAALAKKAADDAATAAAAEKIRLENDIKLREAALLARQAEKVAADAEVAKKLALLTAANSAAESLASASNTLQSITSDSGDSVSLAAQALAAFQNVSAASNNAAAAAAAVAAAAERESAARAAAIRARAEAAAAAERAARNPTYSGPSVSSLELEAAAAEKAAKEAEEKAKAAKEEEEKALAAKKLADEAAAKAKLAADKAAADSLAKEKAKRATARKKIEAERSKATDAINKVQDDAQQNAENIDKSNTDINSAYKKAVDELAKVDKNLALLREKENQALKALDQTRQELISISQQLKTAESKKDDSVAKLVQATVNQEKIESQIKSNQATLIDTEKKIVLAEKVLAEVTVKYEKTLAVEKAAIAKAGESKRAADDAYSIWQASLNSPRLVTSNLESSQPLVDESQSANAQSVLSKLKELYDNAQRKYDQDKAIADKASADVALAKQAVDVSKRTVASQQLLKKNLQTSISKLGTELTEAKKITKSAIDEKNAAVRSYSAAESKIASIKTKLTQSEIDYDSAQAETKYTYENYSSQTRQVSALKKLSDFSKDSVENMKDVISSIQDEANNLRDLKIVDFLNDNEKLSKVALPIFVLTFTAVTSGIVYALLRRRRKNPKAYIVDPEIDEFLEIHRKKQERSAKRAVKKKSLKVSKTKSASTKKKPKSTK